MCDCLTNVLKADSLDGNCKKNKGKLHKFEEDAWKVWTCIYCKIVRYT